MPTRTIQVVRSNHAEVLLTALHERVRTPLEDPFAKELLVVSGRGMALWLNMELARRAGVWAHAEYLYPKHFVTRAFEWVLGADTQATDRFTREHLLWAVASQLPKHLGQPAFERLRAYIGAEPGSARLFQLAARIAETFDEYLTFRSDLLRAWEKSDESFTEPQLSLFGLPDAVDPAIWQRHLWRSIVELLGKSHSATRETRFLQALKRPRKQWPLPSRISVFGLSSLPPQYARILIALAAHTDVTLYQLSPCREYYGDIIGQARKADLFGTEENRLLRSLGSLGAEFAGVLSNECEAQALPEQELTHYVANSENSALGRLQNDVLDFVDRPAREKLPLSLLDSSIQIHSCHSPIREVEVLHDQLLHVFASGLAEPHEVVVMTPDVDTYAPLIQAVFERPASDPRRIPYRISDRNLKGDSPVLEALYRILSLVDERLTVTQVLDLLSLAPVHTQFKLAASDLETITAWVVESGIRWGMDAAHKARFGVPATDQNTWRFGLSRLLLGYAASADDLQLINDVLPCDLVEGKGAQLLGQFARFAETLFSAIGELSHPRTVSAWHAQVIGVLGALVHSDADSHWQHQEILSALSEMDAAAKLGAFEDVIELRVFRRLLERHFEANRGARGFLSGGVTFCALVPMRSIPFKVVCLIGMNDSAFPRNSERPDFNLLEAHPENRRPGDPNRRTDDRYLFLEAVLSARCRLQLSYVGQSIRDNTERSPSTVVAELIDYLADQYSNTEPERAAARRQVCTLHPLQPFSPRYFTESEPTLFSFESGYLEGARKVRGERVAPPTLFSEPLPQMEVQAQLALGELLKFVSAPVAYLLRSRLGVYLDNFTLEIPDREPLELDPLELYQVGDLMMQHRLAGLDADHSYALTQKTGRLPFGAPGEFEFKKTQDSVDPIVDAIERLTRGHEPTSLEVSIPLREGQQLVGDIHPLYPSGLVLHQFSRTRNKPRLRAWVQHLALCATLEQRSDLKIEPHTWLIGRRKEGRGAALTQFRPVANPLAVLRELSDIFHAGQRWPVPFFPDLSFEFLRHLQKGDASRAYGACANKWREELEQSATLQRVYGAGLKLDALPLPPPTDAELPRAWQFEQVAAQIYEPLLAHLEENT